MTKRTPPKHTELGDRVTVVDDGSREPEGRDGTANRGSATTPDRAQPRVRHNDYSVLQPPPLGGWTPTLDVSVVIPAFNETEKLHLMLAALAAQTYPAHLIEVVVVDDGSDPPLTLPEIKPENTRIVPTGPGFWGSANAVNTGAAASDGSVILRLDSDMLVYSDHVESQLRWQHIADYLAVLGHKMFPEFVPGLLTPQQTYEAVREGRAAELFDRERAGAHWVERVIDRTDRLRSAGSSAYCVFVGATGSVHRDLFDAAGGMDPALILGGDTELGYRLAQAGAVFVPDLDSSSWHLGNSQMRLRRENGARYRHPFVSNRVPLFRPRRKIHGRQWSMPYIDVIIDSGGHRIEDVRVTADRVLAGDMSDIRVFLVGPWATLGADPRTPLDDLELDLRLIRETYRGESRVRFVDEPPGIDRSVPFRLALPAGSLPTPQALRVVTDTAEAEEAGLVSVVLPHAKSGATPHARLERTAAFARARHLGATEADIDRVVDEVYGVHWMDWAGIVVDDPAHDEPAVPRDWQAELRKAQLEAKRQRARADKLERKLRWLRRLRTPEIWRRIFR